ncbi:MAG: CvpA family protein [Clostridia bacterium]|nr:CvpA family protein [Clostridia bacterium]
MSFALDIILVVIFAAFVFTAVKKGFVLSLLEFVAVILAFMLAYSFSPKVAEVAYDGFVKEATISAVETQIDEKLSLTETATQTQALMESIPDYMVSFAEFAGVSVDDIKENIVNSEFTSENIATELVEKVAQPIILGALTALSFVILAIVLMFVLKILAKIIAKIFKLPILKTLNKTLGGVLGACRGLAVVIFICTILTVFFASGDNELADAVNNSFVVDMVDKINPFVKSLKEFF